MFTTPPTLFPQWAKRLISPATPAQATDAFQAMARKDARPTDDFPVLPARNPNSNNDGVYRVRFRLAGKHQDANHFLYKADEDTTGRSRPDAQDPADYKLDRAVRTLFVAEVMRDPEFVYWISLQKSRLAYVSRKGHDEYFVVFIDNHPKSDPRHTFVTAYEMTEARFKKKRQAWNRAYPKG